MRASLVVVLSVAVLAGGAGCATPRAGESPNGAVPSHSPSLSTAALVDMCVEFASATGDETEAQLAKAEIGADKARTVLRPDGLWFVLFPVDSEDTTASLEYGCLITPDGRREAAWGRVKPAQDDFAKWADGTLPEVRG